MSRRTSRNCFYTLTKPTSHNFSAVGLQCLLLTDVTTFLVILPIRPEHFLNRLTRQGPSIDRRPEPTY